MSEFEEYRDRYECARLSRNDAAVVEVTLHHRGGPLILDETAHRELPLLFTDLGNDRDTKVILLTGHQGHPPHGHGRYLLRRTRRW
jgi:hypothetical protein